MRSEILNGFGVHRQLGGCVLYCTLYHSRFILPRGLQASGYCVYFGCLGATDSIVADQSRLRTCFKRIFIDKKVDAFVDFGGRVLTYLVDPRANLRSEGERD